ncbi:protein FAM210B, mitochondrial [Carettochelys insculpta]|uniref:protein FAM210B, mitochondrial n=1 Tax=Carettochelys insculpta TaxID=44489 RepID=UPI003EBB43FC
MPWLVHLGPPGALLQAPARVVWSKRCSGSQAAAGAPPCLGGQVQAGGEAREGPRRRQQRPSWFLLGNLRLQNPLRLLLAAELLARADPRRRVGCRAAKAGYLPSHQGFGCKQQVQEGAEFSHLQPLITLQATASNFPGSSSGKDTSRSPEKEATEPSDEDEKKPNKSQQLKKVFKEYGAVGVSFHVGISLMSLGIFYLAVSSGVDMTAILSKLGFNEELVQSKVAAGTSTFVLAYAIHKVFAPVRISITLVSVPFLVRYFRKIGFFKPPASSP